MMAAKELKALIEFGTSLGYTGDELKQFINDERMRMDREKEIERAEKERLKKEEKEEKEKALAKEKEEKEKNQHLLKRKRISISKRKGRKRSD